MQKYYTFNSNGTFWGCCAGIVKANSKEQAKEYLSEVWNHENGWNVDEWEIKEFDENYFVDNKVMVIDEYCE